VYDAKGRFVVHRITKEEASYKLCKVKRLAFGKGGVPHIGTHDGRTVRYPDPEIKVGGVGVGVGVGRGMAGHVWLPALWRAPKRHGA
jgi:ribosomal protein S4E